MRFDLSRLTITEWYCLLVATQTNDFHVYLKFMNKSCVDGTVGDRPASEWPEISYEFERAILDQLEKRAKYTVQIADDVKRILSLYSSPKTAHSIEEETEEEEVSKATQETDE